MADYNLSVTAADLNAAIEKANNAAPQSTTYTKTEVDTAVAGKQDTLTAAQQAAADSGITTAKVEQYDSTTGYGTAIPSGADLNDYTANGQFYVQNTTIWGSLSNMPASGASNGRLIVMGLNASQDIRCTQLMIPNFSNSNTPGMVFIRQLYGEDLWTAWYKFEGTEMT